ncbi:hypothetical protein A6M27_06200 [Acidithiobacillus thiooxidans]|uniref:Uncharacterized protein n=1 Tax=Acidithiobacillus thiooxidans TaxID=930 RepID=A0A1C2I1Y8_ACITH|nr:hypothetical protein A6O24_17285 [Acidithiobacillus thiooxidans]OCX72252.1 hypothetical protein A6P07_10325 [Acidithiobacillus thiooxidans]OCX75241.1 hypothetical protein A6M23_03190 [Acidithiobacillus thiooxidans]OCX82516.1 hypothetical protein A6O26_09760 [Acidithiobacillus thiooxidans]OCX87302.1 hypothetical protein A6P08_03195 [Acidithiobacillus thiooxidans]
MDKNSRRIDVFIVCFTFVIFSLKYCWRWYIFRTPFVSVCTKRILARLAEDFQKIVVVSFVIIDWMDHIRPFLVNEYVFWDESG